LETTCSASGTTASQPSAAAMSLRLASAPSRVQSVMSKPSICTAVGGLPAVTRARSTVIAWVPPPPATGMSCQPTPWPCTSSFSTFSAEASPPEVHQCSTSTSPAVAVAADVTRASAAVGVVRVRPRIRTSLYRGVRVRPSDDPRGRFATASLPRDAISKRKGT
jgi:hypothetical protein